MFPVTDLARFAVLAALALVWCPGVARAQAPAPCWFLCPPGFNIEPTITFEPLFQAPRVSDQGAPPERESLATVFETVFALDIPTRVPRLGFTLEAIVSPFVDDNEAELEAELNFTWLSGAHTGDWVESHVDLVDKFSPSERPGDRRAYTHKLDLELDTAVALFRWLPETNWLHHVEVEGSLDYLATGLPRAGDELNGVRYLDDASPWSFSLVFVIPIIRGQ